MINNLIGNAPHQVPSNADLGEMAYQDSYWVTVGNITVDYNTTITGNTTVVGNLSITGTSSNVRLLNGSNLSITTGNIYMTSGNLHLVSGNISTGGNIDVTGDVRIASLLITQGNMFCNTAVLSNEANVVITKGYLDQQMIVFGF
jgi:hypothetical protein